MRDFSDKNGVTLLITGRFPVGKIFLDLFFCFNLFGAEV